MLATTVVEIVLSFYIDATSEEASNCKDSVQNTIGRVTQLGVFCPPIPKSVVRIPRYMPFLPHIKTHPAPKLETALNMPTEQKVTKPRMMVWIHGELSRSWRSV